MRYMFAELPRDANARADVDRRSIPRMSVSLHLPALTPRKLPTASGCVEAHPRRDRRTGRLDQLRAFHGDRVVRARARLLQRRVRSSSAAPAISSPPRRSRRCSAAASRTSARRCLEQLPRRADPGAGRRVRRHGGRYPEAELAAQDALPERYFILEVSADLRERQTAHAERARCRSMSLRVRMARTPARRISVAS